MSDITNINDINTICLIIPSDEKTFDGKEQNNKIIWKVDKCNIQNDELTVYIRKNSSMEMKKIPVDNSQINLEL